MAQTQIIKGHVAPFMKRIFKQWWSTIPPLTTLRNNRLSDWLAWNWVNVSEWSDMSTRWLMFQWASTIKIQIRVLVYIDSGPHLINCNLFLPWYGWKIAQPLTTLRNNRLSPQLIEIMNIKFTTYDVPNPMHKLVHGTLNFNQFIQHV
jgi:hypothetical protein